MACLISIPVVIIAALAGAIPAGPSDGPDLTSASYCGIRALHGALSSLGKSVLFDRLVNAKYVGSKSGSSIAELKAAAEDFGCYALEVHNVKNAMLYELDDPVLLHVKSRLDGRRFDHWVLFSGISNGRALIQDNFEPVKRVDFDEMTGLWDGNGLIISNRPISAGKIYLSAVFHVTAYMIAGAIFVGILKVASLWFARDDRDRGHSNRVSLRCTFTEATYVIIVAMTVMSLYKFLSPASMLTSMNLIDSIQKSYIFIDFKSADFHSLSRDRPGHVLVDARLPFDYESGHLKGAINIPPDSSPERCAALLSRFPKSTAVTLYCQSKGCPYSKLVGKTLDQIGYRDLSIYRGGFAEWSRIAGRHPSGADRSP